MEAPHPATEHLAYFLQWLGEGNVLLVVEHLEFPGDLEEEFEEVKLTPGPLQDGQFLFPAEVACYEEQLDGIEKQGINLGAERVAGFLREVVAPFMPELVDGDKPLDDG